MPTPQDTTVLLIQALLTQVDAAMDTVTLTNANVMLGGVYEDEGPEESRGVCYAIVSVADEFPHLSTTRKRQFNDHLCLVSVWAPDVRSPKEAMEAIKERLAAKSKGIPTNLTLTGFNVVDSRVQYQNPVTSNRARFTTSQAERMFGQTLGLRVVAYPTT